jgi:hypothetical protein
MPAVGAAVGSIIPGIGTALGAAIGALVGAIGLNVRGRTPHISEQQSFQIGHAMNDKIVLALRDAYNRQLVSQSELINLAQTVSQGGRNAILSRSSSRGQRQQNFLALYQQNMFSAQAEPLTNFDVAIRRVGAAVLLVAAYLSGEVDANRFEDDFKGVWTDAVKNKMQLQQFTDVLLSNINSQLSSVVSQTQVQTARFSFGGKELIALLIGGGLLLAIATQRQR